MRAARGGEEGRRGEGKGSSLQSLQDLVAAWRLWKRWQVPPPGGAPRPGLALVAKRPNQLDSAHAFGGIQGG